MNSNDTNPSDFFTPQPNRLLNQSLAGISRDISDLAHRLRQVENQEKPGNFMTGAVLFAGSDGRIAQDSANLFWDDTNNRLGIGTALPTSKLHLIADSAGFDLETTLTTGFARTRFVTNSRTFGWITEGSAGATFPVGSHSTTTPLRRPA